jgi:hypothetical protein
VDKVPGAIARTKHNRDTGEGHFKFSDGPGWALIDVDASEPETAKRLQASGGAWSVLTTACPSLLRAARVMRPSQSARLRVDGEPRFANLSCHLYVRLERQSDAPLLLERLHQRLWLMGWGWIEVGDAGQLLERSLIDVSVASPERLIFEGPPAIDSVWEFGVCPPTSAYLHVDPELDKTLAREGEAMLLPPPLTEKDEHRYRAMVADASARLKPEAEKQGVAYQVARGHSQERALAIVRNHANGILSLDEKITFRGLGTVTARQALLDPMRYANRDCLDPIEPDYRAGTRKNATGGGASGAGPVPSVDPGRAAPINGHIC